MAKKRGVPAHGRKSARFHRARKKRYLVVAGGAVTERQYFKQLESIYDVVIEYQQKNERGCGRFLGDRTERFSYVQS